MHSLTRPLCSMPREQYIQTILKPSAWGGAIELAILAQHYNTEIASVDVETGRIDRFTPPPETDSGNRAIVIYSGIHYDATSVAPMLDAPDEFHQTILTKGKEDDEMLQAAKKLADALRAKRAYTNTATFELKCEVRCRPRFIVRCLLIDDADMWAGFEGREGGASTRIGDRSR